MADINVLNKDISELIAAGEVIERPASVIKELLENSIDAGARHITTEIKNGGTTYIRITDDGCGIAPDQVPTAFLRHATSKISSKTDLDNILTLGFRGEALASISAVSKVELMTRQKDNEYGVSYSIAGGREISNEQSGCPAGTTIIIRDIFFNVPVRRKFMKRDSAEANAIISIMQKIILSHPEISFKLIKDNKIVFSSPGDGELYSAIYSIYGRDFAHDMIPVEYTQNCLSVKGYIIKPLYSKANRSFQSFFVNERYVRSVICSTAFEEAYKNLIMVGKYPACVLMLNIPPAAVDVNIHPAKAEVRFSDERSVSDFIYFAVKNALMASGLIYEFQLKDDIKKHNDYTAAPFVPEKTEQQTLTAAPESVKKEAMVFKAVSGSDYAMENDSLLLKSPAAVYRTAEITTPLPQTDTPAFSPEPDIPETKKSSIIVECDDDDDDDDIPEVHENKFEKFSYLKSSSFIRKTPVNDNVKEAAKEHITVIGEFFKNYIAAQSDDDKIILIDKHAAHERVIFERLKAQNKNADSQLILNSSEILLSEEEYSAMLENKTVLINMGFDIDFSDEPFVRPKAIPIMLEYLNMDEIIPEIAENLMLNKKDPNTHKLDDMLHELACKAAIKANDKNDIKELQSLAEEVYFNENIRHCPHGRPVMFVLTKRDLEKQFKRIV